MRKWIVGASLIGLPAAAGAALAYLAASRLTRRPPADPPASPSDYGLAFEEIAFLSPDGVTLRGWFMPAEHARGGLILCSGYSGSMDSDLRYAPALHSAGYDLLMFDGRAHGRSGGAHITLGCRERADLLAAIEYLRRRGSARVGLFGFSMGGATAMLAAPESPAVVAVVSDSGFAIPTSLISGRLHDAGVPRRLAELFGRLVIACAGLQVGCPIAGAAPLDVVDRIAPRSLFVIQGATDIYVPAADARALYARARSPKELWIQPGAGHREIDRIAGEEYMRRVLAFFERSFPPREEGSAREEAT